MRYGNQQLSEIEKIPLEDIEMWTNEIVELIHLENQTGSREEE